MDAGAGPRASRSLGLDVGATNLKWAIVEHGPLEDCWTTIARDQVATRIAAEPDRVPAGLLDQLVDVAVGAAAAEGGRIRWYRRPGRRDGAGCDPVPAERRRVMGGAAGRRNAGRRTRRAGGADQRCARLWAGGLRLGAGSGATSMIGLTLGTGVGGVIAIDGRVVQGLDGSAGEIGHQTLDPDGPLCGCGNHGCLEAFAARTGSHRPAARRRRRRGSREPGRATRVDGLAAIGRYLAIGIASVVTLVTPEVVILGGGTAAAADLLMGAICEEIGRRVRMTSVDDLRIVAAEPARGPARSALPFMVRRPPSGRVRGRPMTTA